jgi:small subunit ribosomal protein S3
MRLGVSRTWDSRWFSQNNYRELLKEDLFIRKYLNARLSRASISHVGIQRASNRLTIAIRTARPALVIGKKGAQVDQLKDELQHLTKKEVFLNIHEVKKPELDSQLVADHIARQLEGRVAFRRAMKKALQSAMRAGAKGIRVRTGGRLGGAEMSRTEEYREGRVPLHTLRADIDYATSVAKTTYGTIGVKVWIFHGEVHDFKDRVLATAAR